jgi:O-antigen ligase
LQGYRQNTNAAHSIYFQVLGQHGFVAFGLFIALALSSLLTLQRVRKQARERADLQWIENYASGLQIALIGYFVSGAFLSSAYFDLYYVLVALTVLLARELYPADRRVPIQQSAVLASPGKPLPAHGTVSR